VVAGRAAHRRALRRDPGHPARTSFRDASPTSSRRRRARGSAIPGSGRKGERRAHGSEWIHRGSRARRALGAGTPGGGSRQAAVAHTGSRRLRSPRRAGRPARHFGRGRPRGGRGRGRPRRGGAIYGPGDTRLLKIFRGRTRTRRRAVGWARRPRWTSRRACGAPPPGITTRDGCEPAPASPRGNSAGGPRQRLTTRDPRLRGSARRADRSSPRVLRRATPRLHVLGSLPRSSGTCGGRRTTQARASPPRTCTSLSASLVLEAKALFEHRGVQAVLTPDRALLHQVQHARRGDSDSHTLDLDNLGLEVGECEGLAQPREDVDPEVAFRRYVLNRGIVSGELLRPRSSSTSPSFGTGFPPCTGQGAAASDPRPERPDCTAAGVLSQLARASSLRQSTPPWRSVVGRLDPEGLGVSATRRGPRALRAPGAPR